MVETSAFDEPGIHVIATDSDVDDLSGLLRQLARAASGQAPSAASAGAPAAPEGETGAPPARSIDAQPAGETEVLPAGETEMLSAGMRGAVPAEAFAVDELIDGDVALSPFQDAAENLFLGREPRRFGLVDRARMRREAAEVFRAFGLDLSPDGPATVPPEHRLTFALARGVVRGARRPAINADRLPRPDAAARRAIDTLAADRPVLVVGAAIGPFLTGARTLTVVSLSEAGRLHVLAPSVSGPEAFPDVPAALAGARNGREALARPDVPVELAAAHPHPAALLSIENWTVSALPGGAHPVADAVSLDVPAGQVVALTGRGAREITASLFGGTMGAPERGHVLLRGFVDEAVVDVGRLSTTNALASGLAYGTESPLAYDVGILGGIPTSVSGATLKRLVATGVVDGRRAYPAAARSVLSSLGRGDDPRAFTEVLRSWAEKGPWVVMLDEPFARDVAARLRALRAMAARGAVVVIVSGRPDHIASAADRLVVVDGGAVARDVTLPGRGSPAAEEERLRLVLEARLRR